MDYLENFMQNSTSLISYFYFIPHLQLIPCIQNENPYVRDMALFCLGLACIVDLHMSRKHLLLFLQVRDRSLLQFKMHNFFYVVSTPNVLENWMRTIAVFFIMYS